MPARKAGQNVNRKLRKEKYMQRLNQYLDEYKNILIVKVDNVGSNQVHQIRMALRGKAAILMGKNTIVRKVLRERVSQNPKLEVLLPYVVNNIGFVFTNDNLSKVREIIVSNKVPAAARVGALAQNNVYVPAGPTGLDPGQTAFFQALNIATKIVKGSIEIINEVCFLKEGEKVTSSHVALLDKLNIRPFHFGMQVSDVYEDGTVYSASILDMSQDDLLAKFMNGVRKVAALSLAISYPTEAAVPYLLSNAFSKLVAISLATEYTFEEAQKFKDWINGGGAAAAAAAAATSTATSAKKEEAPKEEEEEEEEDYGGFGLFD